MARADWDAVERDYRAGILSFAEIGKLHGVTKGRISQVAKKRGWVQDLTEKIRRRAEEKLNAETVNAEREKAKQEAEKVNAELNEIKREATALEAVEIGATVLVRVKMAHRSDIARYRALAMKLLDELEVQTTQVPDLVNLQSRTKTMKDLSDTLRTLIGLEREAFSMNSDAGGDGGAQGAAGRALTDAERAVRLARLLTQQGAGQ